MIFEKANINNKIYDVVDIEEYERNPNIYDPNYTAIRMNDGFLYPIRTKIDTRPGFYEGDLMSFFIKPTDTSDVEVYSDQNTINFNDAKSLREIIEAQQKLNGVERTILTTVDNIFVPDISEDDKPEMKALKEAVISKSIDIDKYEPRFGANYANDKRLFKKGNITIGKLVDIANALDIKVTLTLEDRDSDVPNPIGRVITTVITSDERGEEE